MLHKRVKILLVMGLSFLGMLFLFSSRVEAYAFCNQKIANSDYYDCGNYIYTYYEDISNSSIIYGGDKEQSILYLGEKDGASVFVSKGLKYYNVSYDDRSKENNNVWTIVSSQGKVIFDGSFKDSGLLDDGHSGYYFYPLNLDIYTFRQYINDGQLYRTIVIYNVKDGNINLVNANYDGVSLTDGVNEVLKAREDIKIDFNSVYGVKNSEVSINNQKIKSKIVNNTLFIDKEELNATLTIGESATLKVKVNDYLANEKDLEYQILLLSNNVSIKFSTLASVMESTSRRIVIDAIPGKGKKLDTDYCWYYWSTSEDESLNYDDFLRNYSLSNYKGSYSEDKGVILRGTRGTYYLYALAKDDDSWVVVRSEGYILNDPGYKFYYTINDAILIVSLLILAIVPISIYLFIRKKGY